jgi:hypothetical protein
MRKLVESTFLSLEGVLFEPRDLRGMDAKGSCLLGQKPLQTGPRHPAAGGTPAFSAGAAGCGDYRLQPALCGDSRAGCARMTRCLDRKPTWMSAE